MAHAQHPNRWIHRRSRLLLAAIATVGVVETTFLTIAKLTGGDICPTEGCDRVLNSPYATIFGLPSAPVWPARLRADGSPVHRPAMD
jgi:uncharacterized membrane protein